MRLPTSPWECVMFQTGAHAILSTRGNAHVSLHQRNWQFRQMHSVARYIQTEKIVLHTCHSRLATTNYIIFKGVNHPFFPLKSIYNVSKVAKTIRNFVWKFSIMWLIKQNQRKHYAFNANNKLCILYWNWTSLVPSHFPPNLFLWIGICALDCGCFKYVKDTLDVSFKIHWMKGVFKVLSH